MNMLSKRIKAMIITASMLVGIVAAPGLTSEAATKKKYIKSVSFSISGNIEIETKMGEEDLTITASNSKYYYDYYEVENTGFRWSSDDVPEIKVYFQAEDGYQKDPLSAEFYRARRPDREDPQSAPCFRRQRFLLPGLSQARCATREA